MYSETGDHSIYVCFSPLSWPIFRQDDALVIITDIFRATSAICAGFHNEVEAIIPVETIAESEEYKRKGYICAGERDGKKKKRALAAATTGTLESGRHSLPSNGDQGHQPQRRVVPARSDRLYQSAVHPAPVHRWDEYILGHHQGSNRL